MANITIKFRDGTEKEFRHEGRPGGSYTKRVEFKDGFVVVTDEWDVKTAYPAELVTEVVETPHRGGW